MIVVKEGETKYSILISSDATESIAVSAKALQTMLLRCCGVKMAITMNARSPYISIGKTSKFNKLGISLGEKELNDDGFKILFREGNIYLCGAKERGTVYAVNDFMERYLGVRFLTADEIYTPNISTLEILERDVIEIPSFSSRAFFAYEVKRNPRFASQMRLVSQYADEEDAKKYGGGFLRDWNSYEMHAMQVMLPKSKYYDKHPEWYASDRPRAWLCLTNGLTDDDEDSNNPESCLSEFTSNLLKQIEENPTKKYFMLGHEDSSGNVYCNCERCKRSRERNVTVSGYLTVWINAIARRVEKWRLENCPKREIKLVSFSYLDTVIPPVYIENEEGVNKPYIFLEKEYWAPLKVREGKIIPVNNKVIPEKNVVVFCAPIGMCYLHEVTDEKCDWNQYFRFSIKAWNALGTDIMVWYYGVNFSYHLWWLPNRRTISSHLRFFKQYNPLFMMQQGAPREGGFYQAILNTYLVSKLMWIVSLDIDELTKEFNRLYFGEKSAVAVNEFIEKIETRYADLDQQYDGEYHSDVGKSFANSFLPENFPYEFLADCIERLETAINEEDNEDIKTKLKRVSLHPLYMLAHNFHKYQNADTRYLDKLEKYMQDTGIMRLNEANKSPEILMKELRGE